MPAPCVWGWCCPHGVVLCMGCARRSYSSGGEEWGPWQTPCLLQKATGMCAGPWGHAGPLAAPSLAPGVSRGQVSIHLGGLASCPVLKPCSMSCCSITLLRFSAGSATQRAQGCGDSPLLLESWVGEGTGQGPGGETGRGSTCGHLPAPQAEVVGPPGRGPPAQGMLRGPLGHLRAHPGAAEGASRERHFLNKKEANPHVPVSASCWD